MVIVNRVRQQHSRWTFKIPAVRELVVRYMGSGKGWADPFAGQESWAEYTNDLNPESNAMFHKEAQAFIEEDCPDGLEGVVFDPPYSKRQISDSYKGIGLKATMNDTNALFYSRVLRPACAKIRPGGYLITMGYHTKGFNGWEDVEVLDVCSWQADAYDILVLVQRKPLL
jgi:hypothetical protein